MSSFPDKDFLPSPPIVFPFPTSSPPFCLLLWLFYSSTVLPPFRLQLLNILISN